MNYYLAIDIGASSGRHILGYVDNGCIHTEEIYRFSNSVDNKSGHLCWNTSYLYHEIINGLKEVKKKGILPVSIGVDTWGVDFVLLDQEGKLIGEAVSYRDGRTKGMEEEVRKLISDRELYKITGIQKQAYNTIYQLMAMKKYQPKLLEQAEDLLMMPDYFHYLLTGIRSQEYTIASTTGLVNAETKNWDRDLIRRLGLPQKLFHEKLVQAGTRIGRLKEEVAREVGFQTVVTLPASHDTASAFLSIPAADDTSVYISSGTWSLLGVENSVPVTSKESQAANFTNEGGYQYRYRYLKNIMGLWMIQNIRRELAPEMEFCALEEMAKKASDFMGEVDVEDSRFFAPANMGGAVRAYCQEKGLFVPQTLGELVIAVYRGLASCYAKQIKELERLTRRQFTCLHIVGGGSQAAYLNELTAKYTGLSVYAGPAEGTALGSLMVQFITGGEFEDLAAARAAVRKSFSITMIA